MEYKDKWKRAFLKATPVYREWNGGFIKEVTRSFQFSESGHLHVFTTNIRKEFATRGIMIVNPLPTVTSWETKARMCGRVSPASEFESELIMQDEHLVVFTLEDVDNCKKSLYDFVTEFNKSFYGE